MSNWYEDDDEIARREAEYQAQAAKWQREEARRQQDRVTMLVIALAIIFLGGGGCAGWLFWGYLQTGQWATETPRSLFHWTFVNDMVGLVNIVNWFLDLWIGWYPITFGVLMFWSSASE